MQVGGSSYLSLAFFHLLVPLVHFFVISFLCTFSHGSSLAFAFVLFVIITYFIFTIVREMLLFVLIVIFLYLPFINLVYTVVCGPARVTVAFLCVIFCTVCFTVVVFFFNHRRCYVFVLRLLCLLALKYVYCCY